MEWWIIGGAAYILLLVIIIAITKEELKNQKVFFTGPRAAGKTTLIRWLSKDEPTHCYSPTGTEECTIYEDEKYHYVLCDMGGGVNFLANGVFEKKLKESDVVFFVFDINEYMNNNSYRNDEVNPRISFLWDKKDLLNGKVLISVGTHRDKVKMSDEMLSDSVKNLLNEKDYKYVFYEHPLVLTNLTERKGAKTVFITLNDELKKRNKQ